MKKLVIGLLLLTGSALLLVNCSSDKSSEEACKHETTLNLDKGNYEAVLKSTCADEMQIGAANFGLAGFDIKDVINNLSSSGSSTVSSSTTGTNNKSDLNNYMTSLVSKSSGTKLVYMDKAVVSFTTVTTTSGQYSEDNYKDSQFYISLVQVVKGLSLMNMIVPNLLDANGQVNTACDKNNNKVPDDVDATSCSLIASMQINLGTAVTCTGSTVTRSTPVDLTLKDASGNTLSGTYSGLITNLTGTGSATACIPANNVTYKRLFYKDAFGKYWVATTTTDVCKDAGNNEWPCPIVTTNSAGVDVPMDLVGAIDSSLTSAINSMGSALPISGGTGTNDVQTAIQDIKTQACPSGTCTSQDIANYLQNNLK